MSESVLVLGCGPAGLVAAEAAHQLGFTVNIAAKKRKSHLFGCQYLHEPIPRISADSPVTVNYRLLGSADGYRRKVYGEDWEGDVSADELVGEHQAWNIRETYDTLWERWQDNVVDGVMIATDVPDLLRYFGKPAFVFSSIPAQHLCLRKSDHYFQFQEVWAIGDAPERDVWCPVRTDAPNTVVCNGEPVPSWYRVCDVFRYVTCEWPYRQKPPYEGVAEVVKPLKTNCDCWFDNMVRIGRYGAWQKGYLVHQAWHDVTEVLQSGLQGALFDV